MSTFRVLAIDDNPYALQTIEGALAGTGYDVETARSGLEGLERAAAQPPDAVLLDLLMPGIDGLEVLRRIRQDDVLSEVPVIVITSADERAARLDALRGGADDFLAKPLNIPELRARLSTLEKLNRFRRLATERARLGWMAEGCREGLVLLRSDGAIAWTNGAARRFLELPPPPRDAGVTFARRLAERFDPVFPAAVDDWPRCSDALLVRPATATAPPLWLRVEALDAGPDTLSARLTDVTAALRAFRTARLAATAVRHGLPASTTGLLAELEAPGLAVAGGLSRDEVRAAAGRLAATSGISVDVADVGEGPWRLPLPPARLEAILFELLLAARGTTGEDGGPVRLRFGRDTSALTISVSGAPGPLLGDPSAPQRVLGRVAAGGVNGALAPDPGLAWVALTAAEAGGTLAAGPSGASIELRMREAAS